MVKKTKEPDGRQFNSAIAQILEKLGNREAASELMFESVSLYEIWRTRPVPELYLRALGDGVRSQIPRAHRAFLHDLIRQDDFEQVFHAARQRPQTLRDRAQRYDIRDPNGDASRPAYRIGTHGLANNRD